MARVREGKTALVLKEEIRQSVLENLINAYAYHRIITDEQGIPIDYEFIEANAAFERFTGLTREYILGKTLREILPDIEKDDLNWIAHYGRVALTGEPVSFEQYSRVLQRWYLVQAYSFEMGYFAVVFMDISEMKQREAELEIKNREIHQLYEDVLASEEEIRQQMDELNRMTRQLQINEARLNRAQALAKVGNWEINLASGKVWASAETLRLYGLERHTPYLSLEKVQGMVRPKDRPMLDEALKRLLQLEGGYDVEFSIITEDQQLLRHMHSVAELEYDSSGKPVSVLGVLQDVSERVQHLNALERKHEELLSVHKELTMTEEKLRQQFDELQESQRKISEMVHLDALTGLPNRIAWEERLKIALAEATQNQTRVAVLFVDLDHFKEVNDTLGHTQGDELLVLIAQKLSSIVCNDDMLARFGGDEFLILIRDADSTSVLAEFLERVIELFQEPFNLQELNLPITASIGVAVYPEEGKTEQELLQNADMAMYRAKERGRNKVQFFNMQMKKDLLYKGDVERNLRQAIANQEFVLHYQPQYEVRTGRLRGFEALIRWQNPELGFMSPLDFIPLAEETGMILPIGQWVLVTACQTGARLTRDYGIPILMSVNISILQLKQEDFEKKVWEAIEGSGLSPTQLELEITESVFIDNFGQTAAILQRLQQAGFRIALDDFGTGYSSLSYLTKLPINTLKIDKTFIQDIDPDDPKNNLTAAIISLVHQLNIEAIAEGIEDQRQMDYLQQAECDGLQGYHLGRPIPEESLDRVMQQPSFPNQ